MSYTYLAEQGEESSAECFSDIPAYVLSRLNLTAGESCCNDSETESCQNSPYGMTCEPLTESLGREKLTLCAAGSPARISVLPDSEQESTESKAASGLKCSESFAKFDPATASWKTHQFLLLGGWDEFSGTWPRWVSMRNAECWARAASGCLTVESECGFLPTPSGTSNHGKNHVSGRLDEWGGSGNMWRGTEIGKLHCPRFEEWMMDWPDQWTALTPLGMGKFHGWLRSRGKSLAVG